MLTLPASWQVHIQVMRHPSTSVYGLILLVMMVWSKRGNINTAALVTIVQCNTLVAQCSRQLIGPADWVFVTVHPHDVISLEAK